MNSVSCELCITCANFTICMYSVKTQRCSYNWCNVLTMYLPRTAVLTMYIQLVHDEPFWVYRAFVMYTGISFTILESPFLISRAERKIFISYPSFSEPATALPISVVPRELWISIEASQSLFSSSNLSRYVPGYTISVTKLSIRLFRRPSTTIPVKSR